MGNVVKHILAAVAVMMAIVAIFALIVKFFDEISEFLDEIKQKCPCKGAHEIDSADYERTLFKVYGESAQIKRVAYVVGNFLHLVAHIVVRQYGGVLFALEACDFFMYFFHFI